MNNSEIPKEVPRQKDGGQEDTSQKVHADSKNEAHLIFKEVKAKIADINNWGDISGPGTKFELTDKEGKPKTGRAVPGDYIKITLPAPSANNGDGFDWVRIDDIIERRDEVHNTEVFCIRVRPSCNPHEPSKGTAHFFDSETTNTFVVERKGNDVRAGVFGRNEIPNTDAETFYDKVRDALVAVGALAGLSDVQWSTFVNGLLKNE